MNTPPLLIRTDANPAIGGGHLMRCLALADVWRKSGGTTVFLSAPLSPRWSNLIHERGHTLVIHDAEIGSHADSELALARAKEVQPGWIVIDGYQFSNDYYRSIDGNGHRILRLDDTGLQTAANSALILNQNLGARSEWYHSSDRSHLLLGPKWALLRSEFLPFRQKNKPAPDRVKNILVTMGGSDPTNATAIVIEALRNSKPVSQLAITIIVGPGNERLSELDELAKQTSANISLVQAPDALPRLMAETDMAITAAGSTVWELAFLGVPFLVVHAAENQRSNAAELEAAGVARNLGGADTLAPSVLSAAVDALVESRTARAAMSEAGRRLVDGHGAWRVWMRMNEDLITLRRARESDAKLLFDWATDPATRAASFSSEPLEWTAHCQWLQTRLADPKSYLYLAEDPDHQPCGLVRFHVEGAAAILSFAVAPSARGRGLGALLAWKGIKQVIHDARPKKIEAFAKIENKSSIRALQRAGLVERERTLINDQSALRLETCPEDWLP